MHRKVGAAVEHGFLHLLDEHTLATHALDRNVEASIGDGLDDHELDLDGHAGPAPAQHLCDMLCLPPRQCAASRCDAQTRCRHRSNRSRNASARRSPRAEPAASLRRTVGRYSILPMTPCTRASTASRSFGERALNRLAKRSSSLSRISSARPCSAAMSGATSRAVAYAE